MDQSSKSIEDLTPAEKRSLLRRLLHDQTRPRDSAQSTQQRSPQGLDLFARSATDLNSEAVLDPAVCVHSPLIKQATEPARIFLTGATGFLGAFLLHELLDQTEA